MATVRSETVEISSPAGIRPSRPAIAALTPSTVVMTFASTCRVMNRSTEGFAPNQPTERVLRTPVVTSAMSPSRTMASPSALTITRAKASGVESALFEVITSKARSPWRPPSAAWTLAFETALRTASRPIPAAAIRAEERRTRIAGCSPPATETSATPSTCDRVWTMVVSATS